MAGKRKGMQPNQDSNYEGDPLGQVFGEDQAEDALGRLVSRASEGDEDAWRQIVDAYARRVYGLMRSKGCDRARAEEITQSVFVSVARVLRQGQYREQGRFDSWMLRIALNRLRDDARARKRRPTQTLDEASERHAGAMRAENEPVPSGPLHEALAELSPPDREVIELRHRAEMSFKQISDLLGQPLGTVLARHHRALRKLRSALEALEAPPTKASGF